MSKKVIELLNKHWLIALIIGMLLVFFSVQMILKYSDSRDDQLHLMIKKQQELIMKNQERILRLQTDIDRLKR